MTYNTLHGIPQNPGKLIKLVFPKNRFGKVVLAEGEEYHPEAEPLGKTLVVRIDLLDSRALFTVLTKV